MRILAPDDALLAIDGTSGYVRLGLLVVLLTGLAALVNHLGGLQFARADLLAATRATVQLLVVGALIAVVLRSWWLTAAFVLVMLTVASLTSGRRLVPQGHWWWAAAPVCIGAVPVACLLLVSGLIPLREIAVVPVIGILIGGAMTATTLSGRRTLDALRQRHGEMEAALSIGFLTRDARILVARDDAGLALVPGLDQTRSVGLVTLPGAFVGMLLGGATPLQAAAVQLLVLVGLLLVQALSVVSTVELVARGVIR
ncbi:ABC transporter permease [Lapillicoccus sp.]|uniref:ABC transporter permease n=1 Tax=Lapillicoccus sp. TaxID=1909287 RepID=UPI003267CCE9